jgi:hypothetical protein
MLTTHPLNHASLATLTTALHNMPRTHVRRQLHTQSSSASPARSFCCLEGFSTPARQRQLGRIQNERTASSPSEASCFSLARTCKASTAAPTVPPHLPTFWSWVCRSWWLIVALLMHVVVKILLTLTYPPPKRRASAWTMLAQYTN